MVNRRGVFMLIIVVFITWITAIFTNIYISKLLNGKSYCIINKLDLPTKFLFIIFAPFISINLFVIFIFKESCDISKKLVSHERKSCISCTNCKYDKCSVYDLKIRSKMLCKGNFYSNLNINVQ